MRIVLWECRDAGTLRVRVCACVCMHVCAYVYKHEGTFNEEVVFERMDGMASDRGGERDSRWRGHLANAGK